jgi:hypothetical protein
LPISTEDTTAIYQPIDIQIEFRDSCWAKNESIHSVRICSWDGTRWHHLESQIYDLDHSDPQHIKKCGLVFLVPEFADGTERYFVYYDRNEKDAPGYIDHVDIEDAYYYFEPISGVVAEGDYYKIIEDGYVVYGIGQKGNVIGRRLSQTVVKQKPKTEEFGLKNSDEIASFCFSYHKGVEDEDEISSDHKLVSKEIFVDGNLMIEFKIVSESTDKSLRSSNVYRYYYCPTDDKRISVHVKHQVFEDSTVEGIVNVDGRYGAIVTYKSKSEKLEKMRFGQILPFLHVYGENNQIKEYKVISNPESKKREWLIPYTDDCDIGENAWLSYDEGETGKSRAIIFSSNKDIVKSGRNERDGIQVKVAEKEYLDVIGSEIDYAAINFGRNSYEKGGTHDLEIPNDFVVEYDAEFFSTEDNGYKSVIPEAEYFRELVKYRHDSREDITDGDKNIYTLKVIPRLTGRILSHPILANITGISITEVYAELYKDDELVSTVSATKPILGAPVINFPKLAAGDYLVKVFRKIGKDKISYIGVEPVTITEDKDLNVICTWSKEIKIISQDQYDKNIENIRLFLYKNETLITRNITKSEDNTIFSVPFNLLEPYVLKAYYKGFEIYNEQIAMLENRVNIDLNLYELTIKIKDKLDFPPGVNVRPYLTSSAMLEECQIHPENKGLGEFVFENLPSESYDLHISYGDYYDKIKVKISEEDESVDIRFAAMFDIKIDLLDSRGDSTNGPDKKIEIMRYGKTILESTSDVNIISLPPGDYSVNVYSEDRLIGVKNIELTSKKDIKIVTTIEPMLPILLTILVLVFIGEIIVLVLFKKISLNTFLKLLAMALILLSLFQPWWTLTASSDNPVVEKSNEMFIVPQAMIETVEHNDNIYLDLATIPDIFTNFLGVLFLIITAGFILLGISFLPNIILKKRFYKILISASILFLIIVAIAYTIGMSRITEISIGSLEGEGTLDVVLPDTTKINMSANWGLGLGFYLCILASLTAMSSGFIDYFKKRGWLKN